MRALRAHPAMPSIAAPRAWRAADAAPSGNHVRRSCVASLDLISCRFVCTVRAQGVHTKRAVRNPTQGTTHPFLPLGWMIPSPCCLGLGSIPASYTTLCPRCPGLRDTGLRPCILSASPYYPLRPRRAPLAGVCFCVHTRAGKRKGSGGRKSRQGSFSALVRSPDPAAAPQRLWLLGIWSIAPSVGASRPVHPGPGFFCW